MTNITTVDRLEVLVVVDNVTDSLSTNPNSVQTEWVGLLQSGEAAGLFRVNSGCSSWNSRR
jgi:hypothetical protein